MRRPDIRGIRFRATALVTLILAVALVVGSLTIASVLRQRLLENLDSTLLSAASDRAVLLADRADPETLTDSRLEESLIWIGTADGEQLAQGGRFIPLEGIPGLSLDVVGTVQTIDVLFEEVYDDAGGEENEIETEPLRLAIDAVVDGDQTIYVVVGAETEVIDQPVQDVLLVEAIIGPALLALVAALTWVTADRALRPVEAIRSSAASIRDHREAAAVDVPDTGDEIERLATTINEMLHRLAAADERQRQFIGDASHELKSPLANLRMEIETGGTDREQHLAQIDRLTALVDDLLVLSVLDSDRPLRSDRVDLDDVVFDVLGTSARPDGLAIDIDGVTPTRIVGDAGQLRRLVRNLVENANRHAESRVAVALTTEAGRAVLHVDDDGAGLDPDAAEIIFERFGTLSSSRAREEGGTGLGLAIAARIVEGHRGEINVSRSDLGGARFSVDLPIDAPPPDDDRTP